MTTHAPPVAGPARPMAGATVTKAPLARVLGSELRWIFRRPRTLIVLGLLAVVPIAVAIGVLAANESLSAESAEMGPGGGGGAELFAGLVSNGLALPIISFALTIGMLLPLLGAMNAADALAGETAHGTLRGLLIAPVSRGRLLAVKAFGVATVTLLACLLMAAVGTVTGFLVLGGDGFVTLSGSTLGVADGLLRVLLAALWVTLQIWAIAAVALAVSAFTEHPLVVMAATLGLVIAFSIAGMISSLDWLHPYLLTENWMFALTEFLRDPVGSGTLWEGVARAGCYVAIGLSVAGAKLVGKDG